MPVIDLRKALEELFLLLGAYARTGVLHLNPQGSRVMVVVEQEAHRPGVGDGRIHLPLTVTWNDAPFGQPHGGDMNYGFGDLIAHAARTRRLRAGTILGSGTVSNDAAAQVGSACVSERRALDMIAGREPTAFLRFGDRVRMQVLDTDGRDVFGVIDQKVVASATA